MLNLQAHGFFLLDEDCALCGVAGAGLVCDECTDALPKCAERGSNSPWFDDAIAVFDYGFPVDRLMQRFKYAGDLAIGRWLAERLAARVRACERPDLVVSPPSTVARLRLRGFNPALEIAKVIARSIDVPIALEGLERSRETAPQPGLGRAERERNLRNVMRSRLVLAGHHVALVDDVMTTGATANAAAKVLKECGAARVSVWVVAQTPPHV